MFIFSCLFTFFPDDEDTDGDGLIDAVDPDDDNDGILDDEDPDDDNDGILDVDEEHDDDDDDEIGGGDG